MEFIKYDKNDKPGVMTKEALIAVRQGELPREDETYRGILADLDKAVKAKDARINDNALKKSHGDWYEWMLAVEAWNTFVRNSDKAIALLLPNIRQFDLAKLYQDNYRDSIEDLRTKVMEASDVQLITSNPDFVILSRELASDVLGNVSPIENYSIDSINLLTNTYNQFAGKCDFDNLIGYLSVKTSFRPDRRLQIPHEGSLMKALYVHLQTRDWIINPDGLRYYAMSAQVKPVDRKALKTVATHSITSVSSTPQPAVDKLFEVNTVTRAREVFSEIL